MWTTGKVVKKRVNKKKNQTGLTPPDAPPTIPKPSQSTMPKNQAIDKTQKARESSVQVLSHLDRIPNENPFMHSNTCMIAPFNPESYVS